MKIRGESNRQVISDDFRHPHIESKNTSETIPKIRSQSNSPLNIKNRVTDPHLDQKNTLPPLASYPLESLQASLKRNEAVLNDRRACKKLPDNGKKLFESNALIRQAIQYKTNSREFQEKQRPQSYDIRSNNQVSSLPKHPSPLSKETKHDRTKSYSLETHLRDLSLYSNSIGSSSSSLFNDTTSSNTTSSSNKLCFSSPCTSPSPELPPPKFDPELKSMSIEFRGRDMPLKLAIKLREEEERIHRENALRYQIRAKGYSSNDKSQNPASRCLPFFDFVEDDSDDFDGFSEDEYY